MASLLGDVQQIDSSDTSCKKRLVSITPGGIHDKTPLVCADGLCESFWAFLENDVPPTLGAGHGSVNLLATMVVYGWDGNDALELGLADLALDLTAVDCEVTEVCEELLSTVLGANQVEERWCVIDERRPALSVDKRGVCEELDQKGDVCLDTTDTELY